MNHVRGVPVTLLVRIPGPNCIKHWIKTHLDHQPGPPGTREMQLPSRREQLRRRHQGQHPQGQQRELSGDCSLPKPQSKKLNLKN